MAEIVDKKIGLDRLLGHMAWANKKTIQHLQKLDEGALLSFATNPEWTVAEIMHHIVDSADHYAYRISGVPVLTSPGDPCIADIKLISDLSRIEEQAATVDAALIDCIKLSDMKLDLERDGRKFQRWRSTILSQSIHHATEHRAQIAAALEAKGFAPIDLDDLDLWSYEIANG